MNAYIIIPVRIDSKRLPGKALLPIHGKPILQHVWDRANKVPGITRVFVATSDPEIIRYTEEHGISCIRTLSNHRNGLERTAEAARILRFADDDIVLDLQADMPFIPTQLLENIIVNTPDFGVLTAVTQMFCDSGYLDPNMVKAIVIKEQRIIYFSRSPIPYRYQDQHYRWYKHIGIYSMTNATLQEYANRPIGRLEIQEHLEQLRFYELGIPIYADVYSQDVVSINTRPDYEQVLSGDIPDIPWPEQTVGHVI